jgi:F0F1-type ATP synthase membrane subunit b/b'
MIRILFGLLLGAGVMYFLDPAAGSRRREMLTNRGRRNDARELATDAGRAARDAYGEARERFATTASHARDRARDTVQEARTQAEEFAESNRERARSLSGNENA